LNNGYTPNFIKKKSLDDIFPQKKAVEDWLKRKWLLDGQIGRTYDEIYTNFIKDFSGVSSYSKTMIINKLKKDYGLKELAFKHKSATENILTHSNKSLVVAHELLKAIIEDKNVLFFDCSGFYSSSLKKRAPGTKHLPPQTNKQQSTYGLNMATLVGLKSPIAMAFRKRDLLLKNYHFFRNNVL